MGLAAMGGQLRIPFKGARRIADATGVVAEQAVIQAGLGVSRRQRGDHLADQVDAGWKAEFSPLAHVVISGMEVEAEA